MTTSNNIQQIEDEILGRAQDKGQERYDKALKRQQAEYDHRLEDLHKEHEAKLAQELDRLERDHENQMQELSNQQSQDILFFKEEAINKLIYSTQERMKHWSSEEHLGFMRHMLKKHEGQALDLRLGQLTADKLTEQDLSQISQDYPELNLVEDQLEGQAGFILTEGRVDYNYTYDRLIEVLRPQLVKHLSDEIFTNEAQ